MTHNDMTDTNEVLVMAKPAGKVPENRLFAICGAKQGAEGGGRG